MTVWTIAWLCVGLRTSHSLLCRAGTVTAAASYQATSALARWQMMNAAPHARGIPAKFVEVPNTTRVSLLSGEGSFFCSNFLLLVRWWLHRNVLSSPANPPYIFTSNKLMSWGYPQTWQRTKLFIIFFGQNSQVRLWNHFQTITNDFPNHRVHKKYQLKTFWCNERQ